ncbi:MAG: hypothetical protein EOO42_07110 [Flavobacteriales bacterium]|nr:MAG: hypothetical protein EOO42_07110 [Flavobacteriales bacterium]
MKNKLLLIFNLLVFFSIESLSQTIVNQSFVVLTFERTQKGEVKEDYYWTVPADSVKELIFKIKPLYIDTASQFNVDKCKKGDSIDFFYSFDGTSKPYTEQVRSFISLNIKHRTRLQQIFVKWNADKARVDETISIYATPIKGTYCTCKQIYKIGSVKEPIFSTKIYLPISNFTIDHFFWDTQPGKIIKYADFSDVDFTRYIPEIYQNRNRSRAIVSNN